MKTRYISKTELIWLIFGSVLLVYITYKSPIQVDGYYTWLDPLKSLLVSQAILEHGTVKLDGYAHVVSSSDYRIIEHHEHLYYYYPIGTSVYTIPLVWLANIVGRNMSLAGYDAWLQCVIATISIVIAFILIYLICRGFLNRYGSLVLSLIFILGTPIMSTMGAALWSVNFEIIFILISMLVLVNDARNIRRLNTFLLGFFLFSAYLCRPTAITFIIPVFLYIFYKRRYCFSKLCSIYILLLGIFVLFSWLEYHQVFPPYYLSKNKPEFIHTFWVAFYGILLSPSRGILVYSPHIIMTIIGGFCFFREVCKASSLALMTIIWILFHLFTISIWPCWWGGGSFGPRLLTDIIPAFLLLTILIWRHISIKMSIRIRKVAMCLFISFSLISIFINTYQGLYNICTAQSNSFPNVDLYPEYLFNWKYPQFLASPALLNRKLLDYKDKYPEQYEKTYGQGYKVIDCSQKER